MGEFPSKEHQWKPGFCPPGAGRPPGSISLTARLRKLMEGDTLRGRAIPKGQTVADAFVEACVRYAMAGKSSYAKEIWERVEGKVADRVVVTDERGVKDLSAEILEARKARAESNGTGPG